MQVQDFMIKDVISVKPDTTLRELLKTFMKHRIGGVPVVDEANHLVSMVSDGDVIRYLAPQPEKVYDLFYTVFVQKGEDAKDVLQQKIDTPVGGLNDNKRLIVVHPEDEFEEAIRLLSKHHFKKLPVVNRNKEVVGVISRGDVIANLSKLMIENE